MPESAVPRLLHVLRNDALGGLEQSTREVARDLATRGIRQQVVILSPPSGGIGERLSGDGFRVDYLPFRKRAVIRFARDYWRLLRHFRPQVQLVSGAFGLHAPLTMLARLAGVVRCWTYLVMAPAGHGLPWLVQGLMGHLARPFSDGEIAVTAYLKTVFCRVLRLPPARIRVVFRWRPLAAIAERARIARHQRVRTGVCVIVTVGRLDWTKDYPGMLEAFARLSRLSPDTRFEIAGEGPPRPILEAQARRLGIRDRVHFLGHCHDVATLLGESDIFLFATSPTEGIGGALIEAMAAGMPVVCTDVGPCREVLGDGRAGILVPSGDPEGLAQALFALVLDPARREELASRASDYANQHYSAEVCGQRLYELLFPIAARRR